ncbi:glycoside hydrolase family 47 protein [Daedalea quercina L-15889]|uniref:alpha-1,2-Mannosidase n=1 Tax=Daedalea quercina L-15889 TaxID=1314783 RepID=A0A165MUU2_9APHY|nr:glycoside hydrolase family 47 protein [Daedalea quercina L-15889]
MHKPLSRLLPYTFVAIFLWGVIYFTWPVFDKFPALPPPPHDPLRQHGYFPPHGVSRKWGPRADAVRRAFVHAYTGYQEYAGQNDELKPVTDSAANNFNGWKLTLVDALDTMWIMDLQKEFYEAVTEAAELDFDLDEVRPSPWHESRRRRPCGTFAPFFETVIRYLGGLLSAYALSGEPVLLGRADDLGAMLLPAMKTDTGFPMYAVNTKTGATREGWTRGIVLWAEALSCQLEYKYLAHLTGRKEYFERVEHIVNIMSDANVTDGMFPTKWSLKKGIPSNSQFSVGAFADSAHEYLLKQWLLTSKSEPKALDLYIRASTSIIENLLYLTPTRQLLYVTDVTNGKPSHNFEHLSCFLPGLLALGARTLGPALSPRVRDLHAWAAQGLAHTCWMTYADHETGLGPDVMRMDHIMKSEDNPYGGLWLYQVEKWEEAGKPGGVPPGLKEGPTMPDGKRDYRTQRSGYFLRPETVESFYLLWRTTGDEVWRERGWAVFQAIEREAKTKSGYASLQSVEKSPAPLKDEMPSFFLAETLKYLYLLFTDEELIPLDRWVFNTEAHPLPVFQWTDWEKKAYGLI